jgi:alkanesulfonate monooxygenase SsuD/methylene tetrahydromethanopterin reductase-like flavin-dependent oxidoreductase (luciferase family)
MKFGLLLPHFGSHMDTARLLDGVAEAHRLGFNSVWVRDHIVYEPHDFEDPDPTWLDPFVVLAAIAGRTPGLTLGTATLIPHRHPIATAQILASLAAFVGPEQVILAWGRGNDDREFEAVETEVRKRGEMLEEQIEVIRRLWAGDPIDHHGRFYNFDHVRVSSPGLRGPTRHWYGGGSPRALDRVVRKFDGWMGSRLPRSVLVQRVADLRRLAAENERDALDIGLVTLVHPDLGRGAGRLDVDRLVRDTARRYPEKDVKSKDDLDGALIMGDASRIIDEVGAYGEAGVQHFIFDMRSQFEVWDEAMAYIGTNVLPRLPRS